MQAAGGFKTNVVDMPHCRDLPEMMKALAGADILRVSQLNTPVVDLIFRIATHYREQVRTQGSLDSARGRILTTLFYEPSTRTSTSFQAAMLRLGGTVIPIDVDNSSVAKGESLEDTVRCLESYSDVIVLRHPKTGAAQVAANAARIPVLNAGDGIGEHPTQALLDLFTIQEDMGQVAGLTITMVGDLKHGRTTHSLARLLANYNVKVNYVSPDFLRMPSELVSELKEAGLQQSEYSDLNEVISQTDVLYVTRVQKERFVDMKQYEEACNSYRITPELMKRAKENMIVMHPLPRVNEISTEVDSDIRAAYFRQMQSGLYVRMALLALVLGVAPRAALESPSSEAVPRLQLLRESRDR